MTWERFLVLWGLVAGPFFAGLGAWINHKWERDRQGEAWRRDDQQRQRQIDLEEQRRKQEIQREEAEKIRRRMESAFVRFLSGASRLSQVARIRDFLAREAARKDLLPDFTLAYHELLLVASTECAEPAVEVWKKTIKMVELTSGPFDPSGMPPEAQTLEDEITATRRLFVIEARTDMSDPITRNANPAVSVTPVLEAGGFNLSDVG